MQRVNNKLIIKEIESKFENPRTDKLFKSIEDLPYLKNDFCISGSKFYFRSPCFQNRNKNKTIKYYLEHNFMQL